MKIAIVTDSTAYLSPADLAQHPNIRVITTPIFVGGESFDEGVTITPEAFYAKLQTTKVFPTTAQPRLGDVLATHAALAQEGYDVALNIYLAATISGIIGSVQAASPQIEGIKVVVYNSQITVRLMGEMVLVAAEMAEAGADLKTIIATLDALRASTGEYFIVADLQHLVRGGRLSSTAGFIGGMLNIKPLLTFDEATDKIVVAEKVRSLGKARQRVAELFAQAQAAVDYPLKAWVIDANNAQLADAWLTELRREFPAVTFGRSYFGPAIGTHLGEHAIALAWIRDMHAS